jgi:hypothetical protein
MEGDLCVLAMTYVCARRSHPLKFFFVCQDTSLRVSGCSVAVVVKLKFVPVSRPFYILLR